MRAGPLRHRIDIQDSVLDQDDEGGVNTTWATWAEKVPAEIKPVSGRELMASNALLAKATVQIRIRWRQGVTTRMRAVHNGTIYNIIAQLPDARSGREYILLICETGADDGKAA